MEGDVKLYQDSETKESDKRPSLVYEKGANLISMIVSKQKIYHYCLCGRKNYFKHNGALLILLEDRVKNNCHIYCVTGLNDKITQSTKDYEIFVKIYGWIELTAIKSNQTYKQGRLKINFKGNLEPQWDLQFDSGDLRNKWFLNIDHLLKRLQKMKQEKYDSTQEQLKPYFNYSEHKKINQLLNSQFNNVKNILKSLLNDTDLNKQFKKLYLNDKLTLFQANFQVIGYQIKTVQSMVVAQAQKNKQAIRDNVQSLQSEINNLKETNEHLTKSAQQRDIINNNKINVLQELSSKLTAQKTALQEDMMRLKSQTLSLQNTNTSLYQSLKQQNDSLNQQLKKERHAFKLQTQKYQSLLAEKDKKIQQINLSLGDKQALIQDYKKRLETAQHQVIKYKHSALLAEQLQAQIVRVNKKCRQTELMHIFQGQILNRRPNYKQYMRQQIEDYTKNDIAMTKMVYNFDRVSKINFHTYVDGHRNIVLIIKTSNGSHIAAFSEDPFSPNEVATRGGIIFSLTNNKTFYLLQQKKSVSYDEYYLIFGNSQIRIKSLQQRVFSNFGISNGFYDSNGFKVDVLLNDDANREVDIDEYEVHEIFFKP